MEEAKRILLCEDDENLGMLLSEYLQAKNYEAVLCKDGEEGYKEFLKQKFDICVLDVMMPKKDGFSLCKDIKQINPEIPVVFLTAKALKEDVIDGFKLGADDYITKPFSMEELTYRIDAIMHRVQGKKKNDEVIVTLGKFTFDRNKQILAIGDDKRKLTTKESELLNILYEHVNDVLPRELALNKIWEDDNRVYARSMDVYITKLRKYLKADPDVEILNVHGEGSEDITFLAAHNEKDYIVDIQESLSFQADAVGSYRAPFALHLGDETVGVEERYSQLGVWPTLATTEITVSLGGKPIERLTLTSADGRMQRIQATGATQQVVNVSNLPAGIYIVAAQSGGEYFYKKIMKVNN